MRWLVLSVFVACDGSGGKLEASDVCDRALEVVDSCPTSTPTDGSECEEALAECTEEDLELYMNYLDCVEDSECDIFGCIAEIEDLSAECIGAGSSTYTYTGY
jgi:hypothetical protein